MGVNTALCKGWGEKRKIKKLSGIDSEQHWFSKTQTNKSWKKMSFYRCIAFCWILSQISRFNSLAVPGNHSYENFLVWLLLIVFSIEIIDVLSYRNLYNEIVLKYKNKSFKNLNKCLQWAGNVSYWRTAIIIVVLCYSRHFIILLYIIQSTSAF